MRLELTKKTDLAFQALASIATHGDQRMNGSELAASLDITTHYLPHVMAPLTRAGWVASTSGPHGGYSIAVDLHDITLLDLVEAVEGSIDNNRCLHLGPQHKADQGTCALHHPWTKARQALINALAETDIGEIIYETSDTSSVEREQTLSA